MTMTWQELDERIAEARKMMTARPVTALPRRFSFVFQGQGLRYEVVVHTRGRVLERVEPVGWHPSVGSMATIRAIAWEKHQEWLDEMDYRAPGAALARRAEEERRDLARDRWMEQGD